MTVGEISGVKREQLSNTLVPLGGKLSLYLELRTSLLLDRLQALFPKTAGEQNRKPLGASSASRARLGMYLEIDEMLL